MTSKTRLSILLVSTPVLAFVIVGGLIGQERVPGDGLFRHLRVFEDVIQLVMSNYVEEVKVDRAMEGAMRGLADGLDPDSAYLDTRQVRSVAAGESLPDGEVGLELTRQ
jgi:carboxyl-terminal processing protease